MGKSKNIEEIGWKGELDINDGTGKEAHVEKGYNSGAKLT